MCCVIGYLLIFISNPQLGIWGNSKHVAKVFSLCVRTILFREFLSMHIIPLSFTMRHEAIRSQWKSIEVNLWSMYRTPLYCWLDYRYRDSERDSILVLILLIDTNTNLMTNVLIRLLVLSSNFFISSFGSHILNTWATNK